MRTRGETVRPKAVTALMEKIGPTKTAKELGVSTTLLYNAQKAGQVTKAVEMAAAGIVGTLPQNAGKMVGESVNQEPHTLVLLDVPEKFLPHLRKFAQAMRAELVES